MKPALLVSPRRRSCGRRSHDQRGGALVVVLLMLMATLMIASSSAQLALQAEKALRNAGDPRIALQAAQEALADAELDIESSSRSALFAQDTADAFGESCGRDRPDLHLGLCTTAATGRTPAWHGIDRPDRNGMRPSVSYGHYTGRRFPAGAGTLPARAPRYLIERMPAAAQHADSGRGSRMFRITAIGFGVRERTQTVLQAYYRKTDEKSEGGSPAGRVGWREIANWQELRDASETR